MIDTGKICPICKRSEGFTFDDKVCRNYFCVMSRAYDLIEAHLNSLDIEESSKTVQILVMKELHKALEAACRAQLIVHFEAFELMKHAMRCIGMDVEKSVEELIPGATADINKSNFVRQLGIFGQQAGL